ncbi:acetyltransferase [Marinomonas primoryensis]|jgi:sugar O-acyltransferase (sialic acid O-acetyltransferase NeuD family)|uniref:acetyltransferase n=1 Tax=Marinomonas primoryensis TaxID=178399 RepID=UPI0037046E92|tara:strand:- start:8756 stop:9415 length:660 start_codon:yes stop_codon:yes gene_type:complete
MKKLIIFGNGDIAELAYIYFTNDSEYEVVGFTVDSEYLQKDSFLNLPNLPYDKLLEVFPPDDFVVFVAMSYAKVNEVRKHKYNQLKELGYNFASYISSKASNYSESIGENCFILEDNTIQPFVKIGNNVTLWSGNHIGHHTVIADHCFITSQVVISGGCKIGQLTFIGVNSTLRDHINVGESNVIGAGCLILADTDDRNVFMEKGTELSKVPSNRLRGI